MSYPMALALLALDLFCGACFVWLCFRAWDWLERRLRRRRKPIELKPWPPAPPIE